MRCLFDRVENVVGKGENAIFQHFLVFPQSFQRAFSSGSSKVGIVWKKVLRIPKQKTFFETLREMEENPGNQMFSTQ